MPSASAARLTCISAANSTCGAPKPRNAPFGGVLVRPRATRIRTLATSYGPPAWIVAARQHDRRERRVRAAVHDEVDVLGDDRAVASGCRSGGGSPPGGASSSRTGPRGGRRSSAPACPSAAPGAPHGARSSTGTPPCRRSRRRSPPGPPACARRRASSPRLQRLVHVVRALEAAVDGDPAVLARQRDHRVVLDVQLLLVADAVRRPRRSRGRLGQRGVDVALERARGRRRRRRDAAARTPAPSAPSASVTRRFASRSVSRSARRAGRPARPGGGSRRRAGRGSAGPRR